MCSLWFYSSDSSSLFNAVTRVLPVLTFYALNILLKTLNYSVIFIETQVVLAEKRGRKNKVNLYAADVTYSLIVFTASFNKLDSANTVVSAAPVNLCAEC
jgi:hypothetical protein